MIKQQIAEGVFCYTEANSGSNIYRIEGSCKTALIDAGDVPDAFLEGADLLLLNNCSPLRMDSIRHILQIEPEIVLVGTAVILNFTEEFLGSVFKKQTIRREEDIDLGDLTLKLMPVPNVKRSRHQDRTWRKAYRFLQMPNWQWMDSLYVYVPEQKLLFSGQSFSSRDGNRQLYFREHLRPFKEQVKKALSLIEDLDAEEICPESGEIIDFRKGISQYQNWLREKRDSIEKKIAAVPYVSTFGYTRQLAEAVASGIRKVSGVGVKLLPLEMLNLEEVLETLYEADGIAFGVPTRNSDAAREIKVLAAELSPEYCKKKLGVAFGSFSYEPKGIKCIIERMEQLGMQVFGEGFAVRFMPNKEQLAEAERFGTQFGKCIVSGNLLYFEETHEVYEEPVFTERKFLIIGNGAAGTAAAKELRRIDKTCRIEVISEERSPAYNRQMLTKGILEEIPERQLLLCDPAWYKTNHIDVTLGTKAEQIDKKKKKVLLSDGRWKPYDQLILASGASHVIPDVPGSDKQGIFSVHNLEEVDQMRQYLKRRDVKDILILGGGIMGLETASELSGHGFCITIAEKGPHLMARQLDQKAGEIIAKKIRNKGVRVLTSENLCAFCGQEFVCGAEFESGTYCNAQLVILCLGIRERGELLESQSIAVNEKMQTETEDIYACGDCASYRGINYGLWTQAVEMGRVAAQNAAGGDARYEPVLPAVTYTGMGISLFSIGDNGNNPNQTYESKEWYEPQKEIYKKIYFNKGIFCGGILLENVDTAAELIDAYKTRKSIEEMKL